VTLSAQKTILDQFFREYTFTDSAGVEICKFAMNTSVAADYPEQKRQVPDGWHIVGVHFSIDKDDTFSCLDFMMFNRAM
jgi:hypothetical protein